jgi:purine-binding chemotaxis protein CheW
MAEHTYVQFRVRDTIFALPVEQVAEIIRVVAITPVPSPHPEVLGTINLRGSAVPVIDLGLALGLGGGRVSLRMLVVIARVEGETIGVLADDVLDVVPVDASQVRTSRAFAGDGTFAAAVVATGGDVVTVVELIPLLDRLAARPADGA